MTERQRETYHLVHNYMFANKGVSLNQAIKATGTTFETYKAAIDSLMKKRKEPKVIRRRAIKKP